MLDYFWPTVYFAASDVDLVAWVVPYCCDVDGFGGAVSS